MGDGTFTTRVPTERRNGSYECCSRLILSGVWTLLFSFALIPLA